MSVALLFPGQGVQHPSMLPWLEAEPAAAPLLAQLAEAVGSDWRARLADAAWAERNPIAQCMMTATSLAAWQVLRAHGLPEAAVVGGYSVGELAAFGAAGVFEPATALALAAARADAMDRSAGAQNGGLLSVAGLSAAGVEAACTRWSLEVAIRIAPDRCLLGGPLAAIMQAMPALQAQGAELSVLRVHVASHTSQMRDAAAAFAELIATQPWHKPNCPLITNREGRAVTQTAALKQSLAGQIDHTVEWQRCIETIAERRPRCVLEVGAGSSLARQWSAAQSQIPVRSLEDFADPRSAVAWVAAGSRG